MRISSVLPNQSFFENYAEAILIARSDDTIFFVNNTFTKLLGYDNSQPDLTSLRVVFGEKVGLQTDALSKDKHSKMLLTRKNGTRELFKVSLSPIVLMDGSAAKVYTVSNDSDLGYLKELWKESETRLKELSDISPIMIWMTDDNGQCYYFNQSWLRFTGKKSDEESGVGWFKGVHPDDVSIFQQINHLLVKRELYTCEYRLKKYDDTYGYIVEIGTPRFLPDGTFAGYMGACLNISAMKQAKQELDNQTTELKRSNEELEEFAYVASHDMQEPLRLINSYIQLMQKNIHDGKLGEVDVFMKYITESVNRMQALINDMLQYSRVNRKGNKFSTVNLNGVLSIAVANLTKRIEENQTIITYEAMPEIVGDQSQLIRLFQNFIDNAIKFRSPERKPVIHISVKEVDGEYEFSVIDNGIGIDHKFHNRIFVIFQRLHTRTEFEGTGIGLSVCKKIIERHGGEIKLDSEVGRGTTFYFRLKK